MFNLFRIRIENYLSIVLLVFFRTNFPLIYFSHNEMRVIFLNQLMLQEKTKQNDIKI